MTLRALCEAMITVSSNFATNLLIEKLGVEKIRATVDAAWRGRHAGAARGRGSEGIRQGDEQHHHRAWPAWCCFEKLGRGQAVSPSADAEMIEILKRQKFNDAIPAGVPAGIPWRTRPARITRVHHDAGIVYGPRPMCSSSWSEAYRTRSRAPH